MSNSAPLPPPPPMYPPPPPPPPRRGPSNAVVIGSAAAVVAAVVATGFVVVRSLDDDGGKAETTSAAKSSASADGGQERAEEKRAEEGPVEDAGEDPEPESTDPEVSGLGDSVTYSDDVELSLSKFARGTSTDTAAPENTPYVKFTVRVKNDGKTTVDTSAFSVSCSYGKDGAPSESIFDSAAGLNGGPDTRLLAGRSITVTWACELPKPEKTIQIEVSPDMESESAIFTGEVK
ncbi:hypothetical protein JQK87_19190 [Streptomyces sp. G44]|uniref:hypothetical protein n=1 Tax=Streptomyces sp. G44 TaxID=2807632 RepID=UPI00195FC886|nr:hypothetical protein [Streptomyces sp. G44]MBM7170475.1 hypothetical protein [Streptomyces sp. G44]